MKCAERKYFLRETVDDMLSNNWKERFRAEYYQLKSRIQSLSELIDKYDKGTLDFELSSDIDVHREQLRVMKDYLSILGERSVYENVNLFMK